METVVYGSYQLRSLYQPIFRVASDVLMPEGLEASMLPVLNFQPMGRETFLASIEPAAHAYVLLLSNLLHIGNCHHARHDNLSLHLPFESSMLCGEEAIEQLALTFARLAETGFPPSSLVCSVQNVESCEPKRFERILAVLGAAGVRLAADGFGVQGEAIDTVKRLQPSIVSVDGSWFRRVAEVDAALRLLREVIESLKGGGAEVLIKGLESPAHLLAALSVGADLVQGELLARPEEAGSIMDVRPLDIARIFRDPETVVVCLT
ncbi:EAL domain-containing protein [Nitratireductor kimnyeongensis]|uniref:EAL domain-containing protein n=1 Tax=Nitratireductor kimnyeongensis TaxID=430679 RepID=A0ABW0T886_9HYPH|nr:EAL domain-containing protein [Nitratireductor kimnyeongensis]QZZ36029.1 EAL domain-containing protein [Nitratireductor kimnyeongensis]